MALPNIQTAQYGDRVALEKLGASRQTANPAVDVQSMNVMAGGRPREADPVQLAIKQIQNAGKPQAQTAEPQYSPQEQAHGTMFEQLAEMYQQTMRMVRIASRPGAGRLTQNYARAMVLAYSQALMKARESTPFFDGI